MHHGVRLIASPLPASSSSCLRRFRTGRIRPGWRYLTCTRMAGWRVRWRPPLGGSCPTPMPPVTEGLP